MLKMFMHIPLGDTGSFIGIPPPPSLFHPPPPPLKTPLQKASGQRSTRPSAQEQKINTLGILHGPWLNTKQWFSKGAVASMKTESLHWTQHQEQREKEDTSVGQGGERTSNVFTIFPSCDVSHNNKFKCNRKLKKGNRKWTDDNTAQRNGEYTEMKKHQFSLKCKMRMN